MTTGVISIQEGFALGKVISQNVMTALAGYAGRFRPIPPEWICTRSKEMKIAIIGGGISGLTAAWILEQHHQVVLFEKNEYLGGNWVTLNVSENGKETSVNPGFTAMTECYYYTLVQLTKELNIYNELIESNPPCWHNRIVVNYPYKNILLSQRSHFINSMISIYTYEILKDAQYIFNENNLNITIGEFVKTHKKYDTDIFIQFLFAILHLLGVKPDREYLNTPALFLLKVLKEFKTYNVYAIKLLEYKSGPAIMIDQIAKNIPQAKIKTSASVLSVKRSDDQMVVEYSQNEQSHRESFDFVIMAVHPPAIVDMMPDIWCANLLNQLPYSHVQSVIHGDTRVMPPERKNWPNFSSTFMPYFDVWVESGWLGINQRKKDIFCTYAWNDLTDNVNLLKKVYHEMWFEYPHITSSALKAQQFLSQESVKDRVAIIGYWTEGIFTAEDGLRSAVRVCSEIDPSLKSQSKRYQSLEQAKYKQASNSSKPQQMYEALINRSMRPLYFSAIEPLIRKLLP